ncbi:MAG TPA: ATP-binding protein [Candidatus Fusicatenibacter merdavium]|uniref:histidine kinase n=1 Tax=Candidatus Fusicatenibacter merdavium TaxID=2838600 RepID=A0A9D2BGV3_9FIRM|nr:ATP-binding protein [Candidatus Fusicatenibacter merdavium]
MNRSTYIQNGEWVIISRLKFTKKGRWKFLRSLRFRITVILVVIGIVPMIIVENGIVDSYEERAVTVRSITVKNQCDIICDQMVQQNYLQDQSSTAINGELSILNNIYGGRILIIDSDFKIVKDTYDLDRGKTMISQEVIDSYNGKDTSRYDSKSSYIEMTIRIQDKENGDTLGVMLASVSTDEIKANMQILERKGTMMLLIVMVFVIVLGYFLSGILVRPFQKVTRSIEDITDGYLDENISVPDYLETELITDAFNKMLARVRTLDESRQEFVSNVSHELKTPLASMKVLADSLNAQEDVPVELYKEFMQDITEEIDRENQIITDLLSLVKLDKKAADLNIASININDLLELILKRLRPIAATKNVELILDSFRPVNAEVDETKLTLAISNLVENAIKYNVEGGWVRVSLNADHKYFYVTVADSGIGIPKESLDHIFERFYRVDKSHSREIGGTGLGLAIARSAIVMHRGAIKVYSKENEGTTFSVRIPLTYLA